MAVPTAACRVLGSTVATRMHLHIVDIYDVFLWVGCMYAMIAGGLGARALYWDAAFGVSLDFLLSWECKYVKECLIDIKS